MSAISSHGRSNKSLHAHPEIIRFKINEVSYLVSTDPFIMDGGLYEFDSFDSYSKQIQQWYCTALVILRTKNDPPDKEISLSGLTCSHLTAWMFYFDFLSRIASGLSEITGQSPLCGDSTGALREYHGGYYRPFEKKRFASSLIRPAYIIRGEQDFVTMVVATNFILTLTEKDRAKDLGSMAPPGLSKDLGLKCSDPAFRWGCLPYIASDSYVTPSSDSFLTWEDKPQPIWLVHDGVNHHRIIHRKTLDEIRSHVQSWIDDTEYYSL